MKRVLLWVVVACLLGLVAAAYAMDKPTVDTPRNGEALGPSYDITGRMPYKAFIVVMTDCLRADTGEVLRSVPGIRHLTEADGTFHFRCASPRVSFGEKQTPLVYRVRCFEMSQDGGAGPEAVVTCRMAQ
jgi:hypothetical protein